MPSKVKKRGKSSYLLTVVHEQEEYTKTIQADTKPEADQEWKLFAADVLKGNILSTSTEKMTLTQFYDYWKDMFATKHYAKTTMAVYNQMFLRIEAALGHLRIDKIKTLHLVEFFAQLADPEAKNNNKPFEGTSIAKHREVLDLLFSAALKWKLITDNPMVGVSKTRVKKKRKKMPTQEQVEQFFECLSSAPVKNQLMCMLAFAGSMRREEFSALQYGDFNTEKGTVKIERAATYVTGEEINVGSLKTESSDRIAGLPLSVMNLFQLHKSEVKDQAARRAKRNKVVSIEDPTGDSKWVFTQHDGSIGHPHAANNFLRRFCEENKLFNFTPHMLRHLHGSFLLRSGLDIAKVSKSLGHTKKSFTLDTYIHTIESVEDETAAVMQDILTELKSQKTKKGQAK